MTKERSGPLLLLPYPDTWEAAWLRSAFGCCNPAVTLCPDDFCCSRLYLLVWNWCTGEPGLLAVLPGPHLHLIVPSGEVLPGLNKRVILFCESKQLLWIFYTLKLWSFTAFALPSPLPPGSYWPRSGRLRRALNAGGSHQKAVPERSCRSQLLLRGGSPLPTTPPEEVAQWLGEGGCWQTRQTPDNLLASLANPRACCSTKARPPA